LTAHVSKPLCVTEMLHMRSLLYFVEVGKYLQDLSMLM